MTLTNGTNRLESARLVLRRIALDDLPFFTLLHALPEVAQALYPKGRPRTPEETATWLQGTLASYQEFSLGHLAVQRKADGVLIGRCGLTELVVETAIPEQVLRKGWFGHKGVPTGLALTFECELGYTFDPAFWGQGVRSRRVAEGSGAQAAGQMDVVGRTFDRYVWPLATGGEPRLQPVSTKL